MSRPKLTTLTPRVRMVDVSSVKAAAPSADPAARKPWLKTVQARRLTGRPWRRLRQQVLERDRYLCQCDECKAKQRLREADEVDHRVPVAQGGTDDIANLRAINRECHRIKSQRESRGQ